MIVGYEVRRQQYVMNMFAEGWKFRVSYGSGGKFVYFVNNMRNYM